MKIYLEAEDFLALYTGNAALSEGARPIVATLQGELMRAGEALKVAAQALKDAGKGHAASEAMQMGSMAVAAAEITVGQVTGHGG